MSAIMNVADVAIDEGMVNGEVRILTRSNALYSVLDGKIRRKSELTLDERLKVDAAGFAEVGTIQYFMGVVAVGCSLIVAIENPVFARQNAVRSTPVQAIYVKAGDVVLKVGSIDVEVNRSYSVLF